MYSHSKRLTHLTLREMGKMTREDDAIHIENPTEKTQQYDLVFTKSMLILVTLNAR